MQTETLRNIYVYEPTIILHQWSAAEQQGQVCYSPTKLFVSLKVTWTNKKAAGKLFLDRKDEKNKKAPFLVGWDARSYEGMEDVKFWNKSWNCKMKAYKSGK